MKYLILNGSTRRGNTWKIVELTRKRLLEKDAAAVFEEIHLSELQLPFCIGCSNCFRLGGQYCPHWDILSRVLNAFDAADGIVVASATYNLRETGMLKNLLDHMCYLLHRPRFFTSKALVITSVGGVGGGSAAKSIAGTLRGIGFNRCYRLSLSTTSWNAYVPAEKHKSRTDKATDSFYRDVAGGKIHYPATGPLIPYNIFRGMCVNYAPGTEYESEDGIYWTEPRRQKRAYDADIPLTIIQKAVGGLFYILGKVLGKRNIVTYRKYTKSGEISELPSQRIDM